MIKNINSFLIKLFFLIQFSTFCFTYTISGKVIDENGKAISKVNIYNETNGTTSNENGEFIIDINGNTLVTFSHIGYQSIKFKYTNLPKTIILKKINLLGENVYVNSSLDNKDLYIRIINY